jgi:hypothetical protein
MLPAYATGDVGRFALRHNGAFELRWFGHRPNGFAIRSYHTHTIAEPSLGENMAVSWTNLDIPDAGVDVTALHSLSKRQRTSFPHIMRLARWLHCPAAVLPRVAGW